MSEGWDLMESLILIALIANAVLLYINYVGIKLQMKLLALQRLRMNEVEKHVHSLKRKTRSLT